MLFSQSANQNFKKPREQVDSEMSSQIDQLIQRMKQYNDWSDKNQLAKITFQISQLENLASQSKKQHNLLLANNYYEELERLVSSQLVMIEDKKRKFNFTDPALDIYIRNYFPENIQNTYSFDEIKYDMSELGGLHDPDIQMIDNEKIYNDELSNKKQIFFENKEKLYQEREENKINKIIDKKSKDLKEIITDFYEKLAYTLHATSFN